MTTLSFHGAAETVTGSRTLVESGKTRVLVDCGLFQGLKKLRLRNWDRPEFDPGGVGHVILTHAHIDHSGYLPRLVKEGFRGKVWATPATADLADLLLKDCAAIQEEDAEHANRKGYSKHHPALPLFTGKDAERALSLFEVVDYRTWHALGEQVRFRFRPVGHILGSSMVDLEVGTDAARRRILFSGDVGRYDAPLVPDPEEPGHCDALVVESTYGDRRHPEANVEDQLARMLRELGKSRGTLLIPSFAVGRAQQLIYLLHRAMEKPDVPQFSIHLDSPMAVNATKIYQRYPEEHGLEEVEMRSGNSILFERHVHLHRTRDESMRLNGLDGPRVILSSSGMMAGGRVLHHLRRLLPEPKNVLALAGFQAAGTRGRRIRDGQKRIRIHGRDVPVRCRIEEFSGLSAHADSAELMRWLEGMKTPPSMTFVNHGEPHASQKLAEMLERQRGFRCMVPKLGERYEISPGGR